ncbi:VOC family protein, partial [Burkholderia pseudomallei]
MVDVLAARGPVAIRAAPAATGAAAGNGARHFPRDVSIPAGSTVVCVAACDSRMHRSDPDRRFAMAIQKITPFLWYSTQAEEAAAFYAGVFPDSRVARVTAVPGTGST